MRHFASAILASCVAVGAAAAQEPMSSPSTREPEIMASGRGEVQLAPTYAIVTINVTTRANLAVDAASQNAQLVEATMKALQRVGLSEKEVATSGYTLMQNYEYLPNRQPQPSGFSANTTIRAEVRRLKDLGRVIDAAVASGATGISGMQFLASSMNEARRMAMADAVRQARADADAIAKAAGGSLGRLIALNSTGVSQPYFRDMSGSQIQLRAGPAGSPTPTNIVPGELNVTATVFGRWEFVPGPSR